MGSCSPCQRCTGVPDLLEAKFPRPRVKPHLPGRPAAPVAKRFGEALPKNPSYLRPVEVFLVHGGRHAALQGALRPPVIATVRPRAMRIRRATPRWRASWKAKRFRRSMLATVPGTSNGARLLTIPAPASRSASFQAHAAAYGPPPEIPKTAKRSSPKISPSFHDVVGPIDETSTWSESPTDPSRACRWRSNGPRSSWPPRRRRRPSTRAPGQPWK